MANLFDRLPEGKDGRRRRRGIFLLPSLFTVGNMFCGYACIVYSMSGRLEQAAPYIGIAIVLDMLDGRIARLTGTTSAFGVEFDSLADVISFGAAPAVLAFAWGLDGQGRVGWAAGFIFMSAAAMRLARFNIQTSIQVDKRYFVGMPTPAAAGIVAATIYALPTLPEGHQLFPVFPLDYRAIAAVAVMLVPAALMVSTIKYRSFKTINFGYGPSYLPLLLFTVFIAFVAAKPKITFLILAYSYLLAGFVELIIARVRARRDERRAAAS
jgi:CDP-diacylglycerol--serine O-phosphatidyltransferase